MTTILAQLEPRSNALGGAAADSVTVKNPGRSTVPVGAGVGARAEW